MAAYLTDNMGTIVVALLLILAVFGIILSMLRNKKKGRGACCKSCSDCNMCNNH